jgi:hypothetical protein
MRCERCVRCAAASDIQPAFQLKLTSVRVGNRCCLGFDTRPTHRDVRGPVVNKRTWWRPLFRA